MRTIEYRLPNYLASYLINRDASGLDEKEIEDLQEWLTFENVGYCLGIVNELGFCYTNDYNSLGANCSIYSFTY